MTAGEIINETRGLDPSFHPSLHPDGVCYAFLTRYLRALRAKMVQRDRQSISDVITIALPLAVFTDGAPLESAPGVALQFDRIHGIAAVYASGEQTPCWEFPFVQRFQADRWPFCWIRETTLYLGGLSTDWTQFTSLVVTYAPTAGTVVDGSTVLAIPDSARDVVVLALGGELAKRKPTMTERSTLPAEALVAETDFLNLIEERNGAEVGLVRRVFS